MSTPFTTEDIEILPEWNAVIAAGCGCQMPSCPIPQKICQSLTRAATSEDDDYTDSRAAYLARLSAWKSELLDAWYADREAWMAEDPERELEDYPIDPPTPREDEDFTEYPGPEMPEGYLDGTRGSFAPYARPTGDPEDDVPTLYRKYKHDSGTTTYTGAASLYDPGEDGVGPYELLESYIYAGATFTAGTRTGNRVEGGTCVPYTYEPPPNLAGFLAEWDAYTTGEEVLECAASSRTFSTTGTLVIAGQDTLVGCPGPWGDTEEVAIDLEKVYSYGYTLSEGVTKTDLGTRAKDKIPDEWPDETEGAACVAKLAFIWPIIRDGFVGVDPEAEPPEEGEWPTCAAHPDEPRELYGYATAIQNRFRWQVPSLIVPGLITELDPDPDPLDWWRGDYFKVTWQTCFFSAEWTAWKLLWDAYIAQKAIYDQWVEDGSIVPDLPALPPESPTHPGPQPTPPTLGEDQFEVWTGPGDPDVDSSWLFPLWHELPAPEAEGETRVVNVRFHCYPDSPFGSAPQITGEGYEPFTIPDPEPEP